MAVRGRNLLWRLRPSTLLLLVALAVSLAGVKTLYPLIVPLEFNTGHDFRLIYAAAQMFRAGQNPYDAAAFLRQAMTDKVPWLTANGQLVQPYVYPPLFAWAFIPLTHIPSSVALLAWQVFSLICVFIGTLGVSSLWASPQEASVFASRTNRVLLAALTVTSPLALYAIYWGNPVVLVYGAMGGWVWAIRRGDTLTDILAGVLMTATLLKPQLALPLALIAMFCLIQGQEAWARRKRITLSFGATFAALLALDLLLTAPALIPAWTQSVESLSRLIFSQTDMPSLAGLLQPTLIQYPFRVQQYFLLGVALLGAASVVYLYLRLYRTWTPAALVAVLTLVWCFASPYGHANDELFYIPAGLATVSALDSMLGRAVRGTRVTKVWLRLREDTRFCVLILALLVLWCGGTLQLIFGGDELPLMNLSGHTLYVRLSSAVVPLAILAALIAGRSFHRRSIDVGARHDEQAHQAGQEILITSTP